MWADVHVTNFCFLLSNISLSKANVLCMPTQTQSPKPLAEIYLTHNEKNIKKNSSLFIVLYLLYVLFIIYQLCIRMPRGK